MTQKSRQLDLFDDFPHPKKRKKFGVPSFRYELAPDEDVLVNRKTLWAEFDKTKPNNFPEWKKAYIGTVIKSVSHIRFNSVSFKYTFDKIAQDVLINLCGVDGIDICICVHLHKPIDDKVNYSFHLGKRWLNNGRCDKWRIAKEPYTEALKFKYEIEKKNRKNNGKHTN